MKRTLLLLLLLLFFKTWAQDQQGKDYFFGENFHFHGFSINKRMMVRNDVEYVKSAKYIWHVYRSFDNKVKLPGDGMNDNIMLKPDGTYDSETITSMQELSLDTLKAQL